MFKLKRREEKVLIGLPTVEDLETYFDTPDLAKICWS